MTDNDPRLSDLLSDDSSSPAAVLIGFPQDDGVKRNGGRPGAAKAPDLIRQFLLKMTPHAVYHERHSRFLNSLFDAGNIAVTDQMENHQDALGDEVSKWLQKGAVPVILGGGHETSFGHFSGYAKSNLDVNIINIDAHTDVRPFKNGLPHSGSPFRQSLEHPSGRCKGYNVIGLSLSSVAADHIRYIEEMGGNYTYRSETTLEVVEEALNNATSDHLMITMDMDAVHQWAAPGVSAPAAIGLDPELWLKMAFLFGNHPKVSSFDLCEVNPEFDRDHQTVRFAAATIWNFLLGLALREE
jgi:formiminoglutamase